MYHIELTLENLKVIKLWYHLIQKDRFCKACGLEVERDREETRADHETITKIKAMAIAAKERNAALKLFRRSRE